MDIGHPAPFPANVMSGNHISPGIAFAATFSSGLGNSYGRLIFNAVVLEAAVFPTQYFRGINNRNC